MKQIFTIVLSLLAFCTASAKVITVVVKDTPYQKITGFGAAACDGAMCPYATDTAPVKLLYGPSSKVGLNIMRMELSPNFKGDLTAADVGWDTPYDWYGSVPCAREAKKRGALVFATPWSPPGDYKTNGSAAGGNAEDQGFIRASLREDCYDKFFPWVNSFLKYMKKYGVKIDAVSIQNEPDWWVNYSGCLYSPQQQLNLVKNYAHTLDRETYPGVRLISAEPLGFNPEYSDKLLDDETARDQIDIIAGHIYGHPPYGSNTAPANLKNVAAKAAQYGKEVWMTEHSVTDYLQDRLPNWHEQLLFAEELNECLTAGCTGYVYWYMRAHWAFVSTGESKYGAANRTKNRLLPRAYVMSHFSKYVTGSTRILASASRYPAKTEAAFETSAYVKGDSLIVVAIDTTKNEKELKLKLPFKVKSGTHLLSTGNETANLCQASSIAIDEPVEELIVNIPGQSLSTLIFTIERGGTAIHEVRSEYANSKQAVERFDLQGRRIQTPQGLYIERRADGSVRKVLAP